MNHAAVEKDFGGIGDIIELLERLVEFIIVIVGERCDPGLDFLLVCEQPSSPKSMILDAKTYLLQRHCAEVIRNPFTPSSLTLVAWKATRRLPVWNLRWCWLYLVVPVSV